MIFIAMLLLASSGLQNVKGQTSVDIDVGKDRGRSVSISAGVKHKGDGWSGGGTGTLDTKGNWDVTGELNRHGNGWNAGINGALDSNKNWRVGVGLSRKGNGWSAGVTGRTDSRGNFGIGAGFRLRFRKRSIDWTGQTYTVALHVDSCDFSVYDINRDGIIVKKEFRALFGDNLKADALFNALDITTGDGRINEEEFYHMSHVFINGCETTGLQKSE